MSPSKRRELRGKKAQSISRTEQLGNDIQRRRVVRPDAPPPSHPTGPDGDVSTQAPDPNPGLDGFK